MSTNQRRLLPSLQLQFLKGQEMGYPETEQTLIASTRALLQQKAFSPFDTNFVTSLVTQLDTGKRLSTAQIAFLYKTLKKHTITLSKVGIVLPTDEEVSALRESHGDSQARSMPQALPKYPTMDARDGFLYFFVPYSQDKKLLEFKNELWERYKKGEKGFSAPSKWCPGENTAKESMVPASWQIIELFISNKYFKECKLSQSAYAIKQAHERELAEAMKVKEAQDEARKKEYYDVLKTLGDLTQPVAPGFTLYKHQRQGVNFAVWQKRTVIADEMGLGKSAESLIAAKALHLYYGYRVIAVVTKSMYQEWGRMAKRFGMRVDIHTWDQMPETLEHDTVLIFDEAQYAKNLRTKRSKSMLQLSLHPRCKAVMHLTGTPLDNSRPIEAYPLLLSCRNPRVYGNRDEIKAKRDWYENTFCGLTLQKINKRTIRNVNGEDNLELWHQLFVYHYGTDTNDTHACIIARRKKDHLPDLPALRILPCEADIDEIDLVAFGKKVKEAIAKFEVTVHEKVQAFKESYDNSIEAVDADKEVYENGEEESVYERKKKQAIKNREIQIRKAESMVMYQAYARAAAYAKINWVMERVTELLDNGEKVVIFTTFVEVARELEKKINTLYGTGIALVIDGKTHSEVRDNYVQEFQHPEGRAQVIIGTKAGGEGITLTAASYMFLMDRAVWTPGRVKQWMGRIHRIGQTEPVFVYWVQIPEYITNVDQRIDNIIQTKEVGSNVALYAENTSIEFYDELVGREEEFTFQAYHDMKKLQLV